MIPNGFQRGFSQEAPLAAGTVRGIRAWKSVETGTGKTFLRGKHGHYWDPGENTAECETRHTVYVQIDRDLLGDVGQWIQVASFTDEKKTQEEYAKIMQSGLGMAKVVTTGNCGAEVGPDCTCGFYAYWDIPDDVGADVIGVIEGYGKTTVGKRGFRSQKARIVALAPAVDQYGKPLTDPSGITAIYPDVPVFDNTVAMLAEYPPDEAPDIEDTEDEVPVHLGAGVPHPLAVATSFHMEPPPAGFKIAVGLAAWLLLSGLIFLIIQLVGSI